MSDDDDLHAFDLSAWEAPAAPKKLADAVLARMHGGVLPEPIHTGPRRTWIAAGFAATVAAALGIWLIARPSHHDTRPDAGAIVADRAQHLDIGDATVELDAGADIRWHRAPGELHVEQRAGTATWTTRGDTRLVIDAGAKVASVEASGASLRVEVPMNLSDKVILTSAATSAVVAALTVYVYEGHVKATHDGQTVIVAPGAPYTIPASPPIPKPQPPSDHDVVVHAPDSVIIHEASGRASIWLDGPCADPGVTFRGLARGTMQRNSLVLEAGDPLKYELTCDGHLLAGTIEVVADDGRNPHDWLPGFVLRSPAADATWGDEITVEGYAPADATVEIEGAAIPTLSAMSTNAASLPNAPRRFSAKVTRSAHTLLIDVRHPSLGHHIYVLRPKTAHLVTIDQLVHCDAEELIQRGKASFAAGEYAEALLKLEKALACKDDPSTRALAAMAACRSGNPDVAHKHAAKLSPDRQTAALAGCVQQQPEIDVDAHGTLRINSNPPAKILVDGKDTGLTTPIGGNALQLSPGKHKVTFQIDEDRYTYPVVIEAGKTFTMSKNLQ